MFSFGNAAVLEDDLSGAGAADPHLVILGGDLHAGGVLLNHKAGHAVLGVLFVGDGEAAQEVAVSAAGDEVFHAVDDIVVTVLHSGGLVGCHIGTTGGLSQAKRGVLFALQSGTQPLFLLLGGAGQVQSVKTKIVTGDDRTGGGAGRGDFLHGDRLRNGVITGAAQLLRISQAHQVLLAQSLDGLSGEAVVDVDLFRLGGEIALGPLTNRAAQGNLVLSVFEFHDIFLLKIIFTNFVY